MPSPYPPRIPRILAIVLCVLGTGACLFAATTESAARPGSAGTSADQYWAAVAELRSPKTSERAKGRDDLLRLSKAGFLPAELLLGDCQLNGAFGFERNSRKGAKLLREAAEKGNGFAAVTVGQCFLTGGGVRKDNDEAKRWFEAALDAKADYSIPAAPTRDQGPPVEAVAVAGDMVHDPADQARAAAHFFLAVLVGPKDPAAGQAHLIAAASAGSGGRDGIYRAALMAATNYAFGIGTAQDLSKAHAMLDRAKQLNDREGIKMVHNYVEAKTVDAIGAGDLEEAVAQFTDAMVAGLELRIAATFADKSSGKYNPAEAARWYEVAAQNGQGWAMAMLGVLYGTGATGKVEAEKAFSWFEKAGSGPQPKHYLAAANLAIAYQNGLGTARDEAKARDIFGRLTDIDIVGYLGRTGRCPAQFLSYDDDLALNRQIAENEKIPEALYLMGMRYRNGWGVKVDFNESVRWLKLAADSGYAPAMFQLASLYQTWVFFRTVPPTEGATLASRASNLGNVDAKVLLAHLYLDGRGVVRNPARCRELLEEALKLRPDCVPAATLLAALYEGDLRATSVRKDPGQIEKLRPELLHCWSIGAEGKDGFAEMALGEYFYSARHLDWQNSSDKDDQKAFSHFTKAAEEGALYANLYLGEMHEKGIAVPVSYPEAAYYYRLAAAAGNEEAQRRLANFYLAGKGVEHDWDRAIFWLTRLGSSPDNKSALITVIDVQLIKEDYAAALQLATRLASDDNAGVRAAACERLSRIYGEGMGVKASAKKAKTYFDRAVAGGDNDALARLALEQISHQQVDAGLRALEKATATSSRACFEIGRMYYLGENVPKDSGKGLKFLHKAADLNQWDALYYLASLTLDGVEGSPSLVEATAMAKQAEVDGFAKAGPLYAKLASRLADENSREASEDNQ